MDRYCSISHIRLCPVKIYLGDNLISPHGAGAPITDCVGERCMETAIDYIPPNKSCGDSLNP